ncbi:putative kynurenine formamidase [Rosellinia necatrix]|uniref:Kynurenine formamidase n=1 Tax=Rosellinia necatrix TaxID=77044 RepID=A0A1S7UP44_ROSNE|nr:putative kynurenine formamidase [Rosellinia necatrix]
MAASLKYTLHHYGTDNYLQKLGVWEVDPTNKDKYWVIYIHGGAWRDMRVEHDCFIPSIDWILSTAPATTDNGNGGGGGGGTGDAIAGFASLDYRLSPHPLFPQDRATTPADRYRGARHPDHIDDVRAALALLQRTYGFGANYVLVGHSAGGSLAFQLLTTAAPASAGEAGEGPVPPAAIVGFGGLYDFTGIDARRGGAYGPFFRGAFGDDPAAWDAAAPVKFAGDYAAAWPGGRFALIGSSPDDTLVDELEADNMAHRLRDVDGFVEGEERKNNNNNDKKKLLRLKDLRGDHDEVWKSGEHVARMVWIALRELGAGL